MRIARCVLFKVFAAFFAEIHSMPTRLKSHFVQPGPLQSAVSAPQGTQLETLLCERFFIHHHQPNKPTKGIHCGNNEGPQLQQKEKQSHRPIWVVSLTKT